MQGAEIEIVSGFRVFCPVGKPRDFAEKGRMNSVFKRRQILMMAFSRRNHIVGYPACETQA
ncbi:hypothetical protein D3C86_2249720 [compost metagenome]